MANGYESEDDGDFNLPQGGSGLINTNTISKPIHPILKFFGTGNEDGFEIKFENGIIDVRYEENCKPSIAAQFFFDFLKDYIKQNYVIIEKKKLEDIISQSIKNIING